MTSGKTKAALRLLSDQDKGRVLHLNDSVNLGEQTVRDVPITKHPAGQLTLPETLIQDHESTTIHPILFESIDASAIRSATLHTDGAAGPSGLDAHAWRRLCTSFHSASNDLCHSLAKLAKRLCTDLVDPLGLSSFTACCLIALDKDPGVRPIGICETARHIVSKAILHVIRDDIQEVTGSIQLCAGQTAGIESAIHATRLRFSSEETEGVLVVDASNAFNSLNRQAALHNIQKLCPAIATILINTYRDSAQLFVDGCTFFSQEGTTQGDPLAMPMYVIATLTILHRLNDPDSSTSQLWYADDATATGSLSHIRSWWDKLVSIGPSYGYHANPSKTWLVTKEVHFSNAVNTFQDSHVNITAEGRSHLGAALGTQSYVSQFVNTKVQQWCNELKTLSSIASTQPHAAFAAFTHGVSSKWTHLICTIPSISYLLQPLEDILRHQLIPTLTGRPPPNNLEHDYQHNWVELA